MHKIKKIVLNNGFLFNRHKPSALPNVLLFSLPRSGSTWLLELIWSQPEFKYVNEPLNLKGSWLRKKSHINGFKELYTEAVRDKVVAYFKGFVEGTHHFMNPNPSRKNSRFFTSRIVFKVIHGGEFLINDKQNIPTLKLCIYYVTPLQLPCLERKFPEQKSSLQILYFQDLHQMNKILQKKSYATVLIWKRKLCSGAFKTN